MVIFLISIIISIIAFIIHIEELEDYSIRITIHPQDNTLYKIMLSTGLLVSINLIFQSHGILVMSIVNIFYLMSILDLRFKLIPDTLIMITAILGALQFTEDTSSQVVLSHLFTGLGIFILLYLISSFTGGSLGGADIKLFAVIGFLFGLDKATLIFVLTYLVGAIFVFTIYIINRKKEIALIPYISIAVGITILQGDFLIDWYIHGGFSLDYLLNGGLQ